MAPGALILGTDEDILTTMQVPASVDKIGFEIEQNYLKQTRSLLYKAIRLLTSVTDAQFSSK